MKYTPDDQTEIDYSFVIEYGDDNHTINLRCEVSDEITPDEYIELLKTYISHMETLVAFKETSQLN